MSGSETGAVPLPTRETLTFVLGAMDRGDPGYLLEVGAGDGELAAELSGRGHVVVALDTSEERVTRARLRGVKAAVASWPHYEHDGRPFDAVLFTRSLHHMEQLPAALERAASVLKSGGSLVVEDFAFHGMDRTTIVWFRDRLRELSAEGHLTEDPASFPWRILEAPDPVAEWGRDGDHIHPARTLRRDMMRFFTIVREERAPYLYRYLAPLVPPGTLRTFLELERGAISSHRISALGIRWVGVPLPR